MSPILERAKDLCQKIPSFESNEIWHPSQAMPPKMLSAIALNLSNVLVNLPLFCQVAYDGSGMWHFANSSKPKHKQVQNRLHEDIHVSANSGPKCVVKQTLQ
jgi:hypothetical protein